MQTPDGDLQIKGGNSPSVYIQNLNSELSKTASLTSNIRNQMSTLHNQAIGLTEQLNDMGRHLTIVDRDVQSANTAAQANALKIGTIGFLLSIPVTIAGLILAVIGVPGLRRFLVRILQSSLPPSGTLPPAPTTAKSAPQPIVETVASTAPVPEPLKKLDPENNA